MVYTFFLNIQWLHLKSFLGLYCYLLQRFDRTNTLNGGNFLGRNHTTLKKKGANVFGCSRLLKNWAYLLAVHVPETEITCLNFCYNFHQYLA